jgi:hypothetical protein
MARCFELCRGRGAPARRWQCTMYQNGAGMFPTGEDVPQEVGPMPRHGRSACRRRMLPPRRVPRRAPRARGAKTPWYTTQVDVWRRRDGDQAFREFVRVVGAIVPGPVTTRSPPHPRPRLIRRGAHYLHLLRGRGDGPSWPVVAGALALLLSSGSALLPVGAHELFVWRTYSEPADR